MSFSKKTQNIILPLILISIVFLFAVAPIGEQFAYAQANQTTGEKIVDQSAGRVFAWIAELIFNISGVLLAFTGWILDISIEYSLDTKNFAANAVADGWTVLRDIANITFIFILLYIAIGTILRLGTVNTKQALVNVIIIAFLINFSLFFTQVIIDASNILATFFYNNATSITVDGERTGLGTIFTAALEPQTIFDGNAFSPLSKTKLGVAYLFGAVAILLAAFSFLAVAIMFIVRTAALIILMLLSPLAFAAYVLDDFRTYFSKWWKTLLNQSFFAPIYLLVIYVVLLVIVNPKINAAFGDRNLAQGINALTAPFEAAGAAQPSASFLSVFLTYFIILFLINGALVVAKQIGGATATLGNKWAGKGLGAAMGIGAFAARRTVGRTFAALARSEGLKDAAAQGGVGGFAARLALRGAEGGAKATYDVRGGKVGDLLGAGARAVGADFGRAGGKGGFETIRKGQVERRTKLAETLSKGPGGLERATAYQQSLAEGGVYSNSILGRMSGMRGVEKEAAGKIAETTQKEIEAKRVKILKKEIMELNALMATEQDPSKLNDYRARRDQLIAEASALQDISGFVKQMEEVQNKLSAGGGAPPQSPSDKK